MKNKYKLSTKISVYIAVILSLAMSALSIRSLIVKRNEHSVSVTIYGIVFAGCVSGFIDCVYLQEQDWNICKYRLSCYYICYMG